MPLGVREVLLIVRAKDQASRVVADVGRAFTHLDDDARQSARHTMQMGTALIGVGTAMGAVGAGGLAFYGNMSKAAVEYNKQAALTLTQIDQTGVKLEDIKNIGKDVAKAVPAPFEQMQASLFDIFSSMDVNTKQAQQLLTAFSKAAVAGQTDVQTSGRATIAIMNAFKIPAEDVNKVMDIQFQTVRKGVLTYDEFAHTIGRAIPSTVKAGGSIQDLAGMMAFLTRNGQSAAQAATSSARAFDLLSNPKFGNEMRKLGIAVTDAQGNFRPMVDVTDDLRAKLAGMSEEARSDALKKLTTGAGGTIQAMRFLNLAVQDNQGLLREMTNQVNNSSGAMEKGYDIMASTPAMKLQRLKNEWAVLKTEIGDQVIPAMTKLVGIGLKIIRWFESLSPETKRWIILGGLFASTFLVVVGVLTALAGAILILNAALALMGTSLGAVLLVAAPVIAAVVAIAAAAYIIYRNWDTIKKFAIELWNDIKKIFFDAWHSIHDTAVAVWGAIERFFVSIWQAIYKYYKFQLDLILAVWKFEWNAFKATIGFIADVFSAIGKGIASAIETFIITPIRFLAKVIGEVFGFIGQLVMNWYNNIWAPVAGFIGTVLSVAIDAIEFFGQIIATVFDAIAQVVTVAVTIVIDILRVLNALLAIALRASIEALQATWNAVWAAMAATLKVAWSFIQGVWDAFIAVIMTVLTPAWNAMQTAWSAVWNAMTLVLTTVWSYIQSIWNTVVSFISGVLNAAFNSIQMVWGTVWNGVTSVLSTAWSGVRATWDGIIGFIRGPLAAGFNSIREVWQGVWNGMSSVVETVWISIKQFVAGGINTVVDAVEGLVNLVISGVNTAIDLINKLPGVEIDKIGKVHFKDIKVDDRTQAQIDAQRAVGRNTRSGFAEYALGGVIKGAGAQLAVVHGGEGVLNPTAMQTIGEPVLNALNSGQAVYTKSGSSVVIEEGAIQINLNGPVTEDVVKIVGQHVDDVLHEFYNEVRAG